MKKCLFALLAACLMSQGAFAQSQGYTINGTADSCVDGDTVYLCDMAGFFQMIPVDTTYVKDGKFQFKGSYPGAIMRFVCPMHNGEGVGMSTIILENADFEVRVIGGGKDEVKGGPSTALYSEYEAGVEAAYGGEANDLWRITNDSTSTEAARKDAQAKLDIMYKRVADYKYDFIMKHIDSPVSGMILLDLKKDVGEERYEAILKAMGKSGKHYPQYEAVMAERAAVQATAIGQQYTDLCLNDPDGKPVRVSDYVSKNKITMIDFWASWCGPCLKEMPWVVKAYETYHDKGFEVIGISLDNSKDPWVKAIARFNMPWPQMSDLKGWECEAAKPYNVKAIPANVLIDQNGKIIAKNLRENDLLDTLFDFFK